MKKPFEILKSISVILGAIMGAGFISGKEPITYFGGSNCIITSLLCGVIFFFCLIVVAFEKEEESKIIMQSKPSFDLLIIISEFIICASLLSSLDAIFLLLFPSVKVAFFSLIMLFICHLISRRGIVGVQRLSLIILPLAISVITAIFFCFKGNGVLVEISSEKVKVLGAHLFVLTNFFLALPIVKKAFDKKSKKHKVLSSVITAIIFALILLFVLSVCDKKGAENYNFPMLNFLSGKWYFLLLISLLFGSILSTLSGYYPLQNFFGNEMGKKGKITLLLMLAIFSRLGVGVIIKYCYPIISLFGFIYIIKSVFLQISRYKKSSIRR